MMRTSLRSKTLVPALLLAALASTSLVGCKKKSSPELVYVSAEASGEVVVVDPATGAITTRIPVGKRPRGLKISPDGQVLYVALSGSPRAGPNVDESTLPPADRAADGVGVMDLAAHKLVRTLPSGQDPESFDLSPDGRILYVSNEETAEMSVLDLGTGVIRTRVAVGDEPEGVTTSPDGRTVWVTCEEDNEIVGVDTTSFEVVARVPTVVAVHMEALNHCFLARSDLAAAVPGVVIPRDGETVEV